MRRLLSSKKLKRNKTKCITLVAARNVKKLEWQQYKQGKAECMLAILSTFLFFFALFIWSDGRFHELQADNMHIMSISCLVSFPDECHRLYNCNK